MSDMKNEIMHGPIGSPFEACRGDVSAGSGDGQKGGVDFDPFGRWKQAGSDLPITVGANVQYSEAGGSLVTPMDEPGAGIPGVVGSSGTGAKGVGGLSSPYVEPWALKG
jgi:hypothetical protein